MVGIWVFNVFLAIAYLFEGPRFHRSDDIIVHITRSQAWYNLFAIALKMVFFTKSDFSILSDLFLFCTVHSFNKSPQVLS